MYKRSAVIVLHEHSTDSLILTRRNGNLRQHPGEICFPGGHWESEDADLWNTALRELKEELGIEPTRVELVQELQPEQTLNGTIIYPWLASVSTLTPFVVNQIEVDAVLTVPMKKVRAISNYKDLVVERDGQIYTSCQFTASTHFVWGATARIMKQLCYK